MRSEWYSGSSFGQPSMIRRYSRANNRTMEGKTNYKERAWLYSYSLSPSRQGGSPISLSSLLFALVAEAGTGKHPFIPPPAVGRTHIGCARAVTGLVDNLGNNLIWPYVLIKGPK